MSLAPGCRAGGNRQLCRFLLSEQASIITGAAMVADGGSSIVDVPTLAFGRL
jgi:enoyl-[acyl-carrier-protein] reductase (NADH)